MNESNFKKYLYWLSGSPTFKSKVEEINCITFKKVRSDKHQSLLLQELADEYEIPKKPKDYRVLFNAFVFGEPLNNVSIIGLSSGKRSHEVEGPAIILTLYRKQSKKEFESLWKGVNKLQTGKVALKGPKGGYINTGAIFKGQKKWSGKTNFDEVFKWYKISKNASSWEEVRKLSSASRGIEIETIRKAASRLKKVISSL